MRSTSKTVNTTPRQRLVQQSWALLNRDDPVAVAALFYSNLHRVAPGLSATLFGGVDVAAQGRRLIDMIGGPVGKLGDDGDLASSLRALGRRHAGYGVETALHYPFVVAALLRTLREVLKHGFTSETEAAWQDTLASIVRYMTQGAESPEGIAARDQ